MRRNQQFKTLNLTRSLLSRSKSQDPYDPPFSPILKPPKIPNPNPKKTPIPPKSKPPPLKSDLPFDFRYSYSESDPNAKPIGFREPPRFSPFGPGRLDREWNGVSARLKEGVEKDRVLREREEVLGEPLTEEVEELVERYRHSDCSRQINLGPFSCKFWFYYWVLCVKVWFLCGKGAALFMVIDTQ